MKTDEHGNADPLARAGLGRYTQRQRRIELLALSALLGCLVWVIFRLTVTCTSVDLFVLLPGLLVGVFVADIVSGLVHWTVDTWGSADWPIVGHAFIRPFREHHIDEEEITRHDVVETNGANAVFSLVVPASMVVFRAGTHVTFLSRWLCWVGLGFSVFNALTSQIHKWAHTHKPPSVVRWLQRMHVLLRAEHHAVHHRAPHTKAYAITTGWSNAVLDHTRFWRGLEWLITRMTGALPRKDDAQRIQAAHTLTSSIAGKDST